jgi:hypothetical protein
VYQQELQNLGVQDVGLVALFSTKSQDRNCVTANPEDAPKTIEGNQISFEGDPEGGAGRCSQGDVKGPTLHCTPQEAKCCRENIKNIKALCETLSKCVGESTWSNLVEATGLTLLTRA